MSPSENEALPVKKSNQARHHRRRAFSIFHRHSRQVGLSHRLLERIAVLITQLLTTHSRCHPVGAAVVSVSTSATTTSSCCLSSHGLVQTCLILHLLRLLSDGIVCLFCPFPRQWYISFMQNATYCSKTGFRLSRAQTSDSGFSCPVLRFRRKYSPAAPLSSRDPGNYTFTSSVVLGMLSAESGMSLWRPTSDQHGHSQRSTWRLLSHLLQLIQRGGRRETIFSLEAVIWSRAALLAPRIACTTAPPANITYFVRSTFVDTSSH